MGIFNTILGTFQNKDTVFLKESSSLSNKYKALNKLNSKYPNNKDLLNELYMVKRGLNGENEIAYQLQKANIGMYVLRDVKVKYKDLSAQIDYIVITPIYTYYIECKNLVGNIIVNDKGDFIREYQKNGSTLQKGMYSPLTQVEAQREVIRKIWEDRTNKFIKFWAAKNFEYYRRVLVVVANHDTILNTDNAPEDIKRKVIRADNLVRQIKYDIDNCQVDDYISSNKEMLGTAKTYLDISIADDTDYYEYYKNKYIKDDLKERLVSLRKDRAKKMNIPFYYVFTDEELKELVRIRPKTLEELKDKQILTPVKINTHGKIIIEEINKE